MSYEIERAERFSATLHTVTFDWTSDSSGDASEDTTETFHGWIWGAFTIPDGSAAPTADYDVTVVDSGDFDFLGGGGADRSDTDKEYVHAKSAAGDIAPIPIVGETLGISVSNAGDSKQGQVVVVLQMDHK